MMSIMSSLKRQMPPSGGRRLGEQQYSLNGRIIGRVLFSPPFGTQATPLTLCVAAAPVYTSPKVHIQLSLLMPWSESGGNDNLGATPAMATTVPSPKWACLTLAPTGSSDTILSSTLGLPIAETGSTRSVGKRNTLPLPFPPAYFCPSVEFSDTVRISSIKRK